MSKKNPWAAQEREAREALDRSRLSIERRAPRGGGYVTSEQSMKAKNDAKRGRR